MTTKFKGTASGSQNFGGDFLAIRKVTADATGVINSISFNVAAISVSIDIRAMIWTDSGGAAALLKDYSAKTAVSTTGDKTFPLTQGFSLTNGQSYWIGLVYICSNGQISYPTDTVNTYSSATYNRQAGTVATMRDSPTLNTPPDGTLVALGAAFMVWADQTTSTITSDTLAKSTLTLTGKTFTDGKSVNDTLALRAMVLSGKSFFSTVTETFARGTVTLTGQAFPNGLFKRDRYYGSTLTLRPSWHGYSPDSDNNVTDNEARRRGFKTGLSLWGASDASGGDTNARVNTKWWSNLLFGRS